MKTVPLDRNTLTEHLAVQYPFNVIADEDGGYVILYPDLPGCMTQVEDVGEIPLAATEIRELWIETEFEDGHDIPPPSYPEGYSGKFNLRIARSLHRRLAESAEREGVSLNQYAMSLLDKGDALSHIEQRLAEIQSSLNPDLEPAAAGADPRRGAARRPRRSPAAQAAVTV